MYIMLLCVTRGKQCCVLSTALQLKFHPFTIRLKRNTLPEEKGRSFRTIVSSSYFVTDVKTNSEKEIFRSVGLVTVF
jgi:hypothetical protein